MEYNDDAISLGMDLMKYQDRLEKIRRAVEEMRENDRITADVYNELAGIIKVM